MAGLNRATILGRLGQDPDVRYTQAGGMITTLSVATSINWKDKQTGEAQERTEWHRVKFFGRLAEIAGEYLKKGRSIYVEGRLKTRKWQDKEGQDRWTTEIVADQMQMLGSREEGGGGGSYSRARQDSPPEPATAGSGPRGGGGGRSGGDRSGGFDDGDDDIPF